MKKLLVISGRGFPPELDTGVFRTLKIVKYLSRLGYNSIVLAPSMSAFKERDFSLMDDISEGTKVVRSINPLFMLEHHSLQKLIKSFLIFDSDLGWLPFGYRRACRILRQERIDAIYSSSPPVVSHIVASMLKKRTDIPWVADFRDAWIGHQEYWALTKHHKRFEEYVEGRVMSTADRLVFASDPQLEEFKRMHPQISQERLLFLPTGYDEEDFNSLFQRKSGVLTFSHIGTVNYHYPLDFLRAFRELAAEIPEFRKLVRIVFCGKIHPKKMRELKALNLGSMLNIRGYLSHKDALQQIADSDVLLLFFADNAGYEKVYTLKIFEYLAARRFVLAIVPPESVAVKVLREVQCGIALSPSDIEAIKSEIRGLFEAFLRKGKIDCMPDENAIARYSSRRSAEILVHHLDALTGGRG
ncbi:MAG: glycosyltransferase [Thermoplasmata archaeon]